MSVTFLPNDRFHVIAGEPVIAIIRAERAALVDLDESLTEQQERHATQGIRGAEVVQTNRGWSLRYDSGLQGWSLIAIALAFYPDAEEAARCWVASDPEHRYAWVRRHLLE